MNLRKITIFDYSLLSLIDTSLEIYLNCNNTSNCVKSVGIYSITIEFHTDPTPILPGGVWNRLQIFA